MASSPPNTGLLSNETLLKHLPEGSDIALHLIYQEIRPGVLRALERAGASKPEAVAYFQAGLIEASSLALLAFQGEPVKFASAKLADGTAINIQGDSLAVGVMVSVMTEAGEAPLPDGEYTLEDGTVFYVSGGSVSKVKAPEATVPAISPILPSGIFIPKPSVSLYFFFGSLFFFIW